MKANETPEKIYLQVCGDCNDNECDNCKFEDLEDNITWCKDRIFKKDIEYIRKDVFIEKAAKWINEYTNLSEKLVIENFVNYMKEENV